MQVSKVAGSACSYAAFPSSIKSRYCTSTIGEIATRRRTRPHHLGAHAGCRRDRRDAARAHVVVRRRVHLVLRRQVDPALEGAGRPVAGALVVLDAARRGHPLAVAVLERRPVAHQSSWPHVPCLTYITVSMHGAVPRRARKFARAVVCHRELVEHRTGRSRRPDTKMSRCCGGGEAGALARGAQRGLLEQARGRRASIRSRAAR